MKLNQILAQWTRPAALLAAIAMTHTLANAQTVSDIVKKGKVTIGVVSGAPPFGTTDAEGKPAGYDVDVANLVAKYMAVPVEIVPLTSPSRIPALESGKVDFLVATLAPTPERLDRLVELQRHLLELGAEQVRPGGRLVYAVCSLLSREGAGQIDRFLEHRSSWIRDETPISAGRLDGGGRLLTPGHDRTDGFFVARMRRPC